MMSNNLVRRPIETIKTQGTVVQRGEHLSSERLRLRLIELGLRVFH
jgi:hypothetical protein